MPNSLPFPIRVAAGLVASGIDTIRTLPEQLPGMGVQLVGAVTKVGLRLQQEVSELAARGDELLESRTEPQEHPAWARFDDEETAGQQDADRAPAGGAAANKPAANKPAADKPAANKPAANKPAADKPAAEEPAAAKQTSGNPAAAEHASETETDRAREPAAPPAAPVADPATAGGLPLDGYDAMTIGQVRGHLRRLSRGDVRTLLEHEAASANRASFLTLLANRITTLDHGAAQ